MLSALCFELMMKCGVQSINSLMVNGIGISMQLRGIDIAESAKWHLNRSQFGIRIDHDLASISDHSLASQSITIWHASDH